ncbi:AT-hook motif nuclear-localized protein 28-like [Lathyrus oleraceus]|uniref:AT-hook motif nuclear-localized protein 28-like n=1 Tax=Pisum sativum TaxID=3888 RepID=UPI0021D09986|nr:AT-hook motif nuclear-localized protein 28-like [Pisum sativum]
MADNVLSQSSPSFDRCISHPQELSEDLATPSSKRSRGRPKGSKNKPKPPSVIMVEPEIFMEPIFIEIPAGKDVVESIIKTAWRHQADISVLKGSGLVSEVSLLNSASQNSHFTIRGHLQMTSLSGTYFNPESDRDPSEFVVDPAYSSFSIFLSGNHGQVFGGIVRGRVRASGVVLVSATLLRKPKFCRVASNNEDGRDDKKDDPRHGGAVVHDGVVAPQHNSANDTANVSRYGVADANSTQLNSQVVNPQAPAQRHL